MDIVMNIGRSLIGIVGLIGLAFLLSRSRKKIDWGLVGKGIAMQIVLALLILKVPFVKGFFQLIVNFFVLMIEATYEASDFMFGELAKPGGGYGFAFYVLPTIIFFAALSSVLYYLGILQKVVSAFAWVMRKFMHMTGAESLAAAANVFIGQTEAPLVVKPYLEKMSKSEMMCLMTGGMATIAGGVFGAYMGMLGGTDPVALRDFGMHLLTASIISAPAAIVAAKIIFPETEKDVVQEQTIDIPREQAGSNLLDALAKGTTDGLKLAVNVGAMLIAFMAFVYFFNRVLVEVGDWTNLNEFIAASSGGQYDALSLQYLLGFLFAPVAWLIGAEGSELLRVGQLLGEKMILNEFIAYDSLAGMKDVLSDRTVKIATYALCGFANFGSIGIQIGGIGAIAPGQRKNLSKLGLLAMLGGTIACLLTAAVAGMLI